ncbi:MAG: 3-isopropylmalate dehydratase large subunit [Burkholderiaceae bacterium]|nr:3-isopropylmalate dehydratase large subunit [Burkholderiaceae bacterium]
MTDGTGTAGAVGATGKGGPGASPWAGKTLFDRIWDEHLVMRLGETDLLHVDRHLLHEMTTAQAYEGLRARGLRAANPQLNLATVDHIVATRPGRSAESYAVGLPFIRAHRRAVREHGFRIFDLGDPGQGIVHVVGPETGAVLPGATVACGDSHTCTLGAIGAIGIGIGTSEVEQVLATQTLRLRRPRSMRITIDATLAPGLNAKDLALHLIATVGAGGGIGYAVEYAGSAVRALSVEGRMTLCNMSVEFGARTGIVAPDQTVIEWLRGRRFAPRGEQWERAVAHWAGLRSGDDARFDAELRLDASEVVAMVSWGTTPAQAIPVSGRVPHPRDEKERRALAYIGLSAGEPIAGVPVDIVFIGSCTNARLGDLREAAQVVRGRKVAPGVRAMVVPGSTQVRLAAQAEGLDRVFADAGFEWHEAGCSMCCALGPDRVEGRKRCVSTSNRNFEDRQGPGARTHLASPATAAASALAGCIAQAGQA